MPDRLHSRHSSVDLSQPLVRKNHDWYISCPSPLRLNRCFQVYMHVFSFVWKLNWLDFFFLFALFASVRFSHCQAFFILFFLHTLVEWEIVVHTLTPYFSLHSKLVNVTFGISMHFDWCWRLIFTLKGPRIFRMVQVSLNRFSPNDYLYVPTQSKTYLLQEVRAFVFCYFMLVNIFRFLI